MGKQDVITTKLKYEACLFFFMLRESAHLLGENFAFESVSSEIQQLLSKVIVKIYTVIYTINC